MPSGSSKTEEPLHDDDLSWDEWLFATERGWYRAHAVSLLLHDLLPDLWTKISLHDALFLPGDLVECVSSFPNEVVEELRDSLNGLVTTWETELANSMTNECEKLQDSFISRLGFLHGKVTANTNSTQSLIDGLKAQHDELSQQLASMRDILGLFFSMECVLGIHLLQINATSHSPNVAMACSVPVVV